MNSKLLVCMIFLITSVVGRAQTSKIELANWDMGNKSITKTDAPSGSFYSLNFRNEKHLDINEFMSVNFEDDSLLIEFFTLCDSLLSLRLRKGESQSFGTTIDSRLVVAKSAAITELSLHRGEAWCWLSKSDLKTFRKKVLPKLNQD